MRRYRQGIKVMTAFLLFASFAAAQTPHGGNVTWTAPTTVGGSGTVANYVLNRCTGTTCSSTGAGTWTQLAVVSGATSYLDSTVVSGTTYMYSVQTVDTSGNKSAPAYSAAYTPGTIPSNPNPPTGVTVTTQ